MYYKGVRIRDAVPAWGKDNAGIIAVLMHEKAYQHDNDRCKEYEYRNPVHAVHQTGIQIPRFVAVALADVEIGKQLLPHKTKGLSYKVTKN